MICLIATSISRVRAGGVVNSTNETSLDNALSGGGTVTFSISGTITVTNPKTISVDTVIDGSGQTVTISGGSAKRVFQVNPGVNFTLKNLTIANGRNSGTSGSNGTDGSSPTAGGNGGYGGGGGVLNAAGSLTVTGVTFLNNSAIGGNGGRGGNATSFNGAPGGAGGSAYGGAIWNSNGVATITMSSFYNSSGTGGAGGNGGNAGSSGNGNNGGAGGAGGSAFGGAIYNSNGGIVSVTDCTISTSSGTGGAPGLGGNRSGLGSHGSNGAAGTGNGGGIHSDGGSVTLTFSAVYANGVTGATGGAGKTGVNYEESGTAGSAGGTASGGGVFNNGGTLAVTNCTVYANTATGGTGGQGGDGANSGFGGNGGNGGAGGAATGGGVYGTAGGITVSGNTTIDGNGAQGGSGGAGGHHGGVAHDGSSGASGTSNGGGIANGTGTVTTLNTIVADSTYGGNGSGAITDGGNNISSDGTCNFTAQGSLNNTSPQLGSYSANGGSTSTISLLSASPAINAGNPSTAPPTDQRHFYRSNTCDIGAYEYGGTNVQVAIWADGPEASQDGDIGVFEILRVGSTNSALTVNYSISGSAANGTDYSTISTSATIPAGRDNAQVFIQPVATPALSSNRTVILSLSSSANYNTGWPSNATVTIANKSLIDRTKRYFRGTGTEPTYLSFVIPLDFQRGVWLTNVGGNLTTLFPGNPWTTTYYHYSATNPASATNLSGRIQFNGPIAAFGSRVGGSSLCVGQHYSFGVFSGVNQSTNYYQIQIKAYNRSGFSLAGTTSIYIPQEFETDAWAGFATNGYSQTVSGYGLTTTVTRNAAARWGASWNHSYILTHLADSGSTNYIYEVDVMGYTDQGWMVLNGSSLGVTSFLYTMEFETRPPWRATFVDQTQFEGSPMPPSYQGKSIQELLTNAPPVTNSISLPQSASYYTNLDNSPELRRHPILDQLVSDMRQDPVALANYVINEIDLTDAIHYNDNGSVSEESVNLGGVNRSALDVFQEGQGSPMEQCGLLVYLLRQAGVPAVYVFPPHNGLKLLDTRLSKLLRMQVKGIITEQDVLQTGNSLIAVNYPWIAAYINGGWVHIFPWLKDTELVEGLDLYDYMPPTYPNAYLWVKDYLYSKTNIMNVSTNSDQTPAVLFPAFLQQSLLQTAPGISVDDIGMKDINRRNYYARWQDFPRPTWVTNTCTAVENLTDPAITNVFAGLTNVFDTVSVQVSSDANPSKIIVTGNLRTADLLNRKFLLRTDRITNTTTYTLTLSLPAYRTNITSQSSFTNDSTLLNKQVATVTLDNTDDRLTMTITHKRHRALASWFNLTPPMEQEVFYQVSATDVVTDQRPLRKGDLAAICLNAGRVTRKMLNVHATELWQMEQTFSTNSSATISPDVYQGTVAYLMGMAYYERDTRFIQFAERLNKVRSVSWYASGLSKLSPKRDSNGNLYNGDVTLIQPNVDMFYRQVTVAGNGTYRPDSGRDSTSAATDFFQITIANGSALEHEIINGFFKQYDAVSTVKLLQLAQSRSATNGQAGILVLNRNNYATEGEKYYPSSGTTKLRNYDPTMWGSIVAAFNGAGDSDYTQAFVTPGAITNSTGSYHGMGALIFAPYSFAALISQANGGFGSYVGDSAFVATNAENMDLQEDPNHNFSISLSAPSASNKTGASDSVAGFSVPEVVNNAVAGDYAISPFQLLSTGQTTDLLTLSAPTSDGEGYAQTIQVNETSGNLGPPVETDKLMDKVLDPVSAVTGEFYVDASDLVLPGPMPLEIRRNYSSLNLADNQFGWGWKLNCMPYLSVNTNGTVIFAAEFNGTVVAYEVTGTNANVWLPTLARNPLLDNNRTTGIGSTANLFRCRIDKSVNGTNTFYKLSSPDGSVRTFQALSFNNGAINQTRPYLTTWQDNRGNAYTFQYGTDPTQPDFGQARRIQSSNGNYLGFYFDVYGHIIEAYSGDGRRLQYEYDAYGDLVTVTLPDESQISYQYDHQSLSITNGQTVTTAPYSTHLIVKEIKPDGRLLINQYDNQRRVTNQLATAGQDLNPIRNGTFIYNNNFNITNSYTTPIAGYTLIVDVFNNTNRYDYTNGLITKITDPLNQTIVQDWYDPTETNKTGYYPRSLESRTDKRGLVTTFKYDSNGNITNTTITGDLTGEGITNQQAVTSATYNTNNLPLQITDPVGNVVRYVYDPNFLFLPQQMIKLAGTNPVSTNFLVYYNITNVFTSGGTTFTNLALGMLQRQIRAYNSSDAATNEFNYDGRGFLIQQTNYSRSTDPNMVLNFFYNSRDQLVERVNSANRTNRFDYDGMGRLKWSETIDETGTRLSGDYSYYNDNGELVWSDGPRYNPEDYVWRDYDGAGRRTTEIRWRSRTKADGSGVEAETGDNLYSTTFFQYDGFGNLTRVSDPRGNYKLMDYDSIGQLLKERFYDGTTGSGMATNSYAYEPGGEVSYFTNALGGVTAKTYTSTGKLKQQVQPDQGTVLWTYYLDGRLRREYLASGSYYETTYDDLNRLVNRTFSGDASFLETKIFDRRGNLVTTINAVGAVFSTTYDGLDRIKQAVGPATSGGSSQQVTTYTYDDSGKKLTVSDSLGDSTVTWFDALGRSITNAVYDLSSNRVEVTTTVYSPDHHGVTTITGSGTGAITTTTFTDTFGKNVLTQRFPASGVTNFAANAYDVAGNLTATRDELGKTNTFAYDALNRLKTQVLPDGATVNLAYDFDGNLTSRAMPGGLTWSASFDAANRILSEQLASSSATNRQFTYTYFTSGPNVGLLQTKLDKGRSVTNTLGYDTYLRVATNAFTGSLTDQNVALNYQYDRRSLLTNLTQSAGTTTVTTTAVQRTLDGYGQISEEKVVLNGAVTSDFVQNWDAAARRSLLWQFGTGSPGAISYSYQANGLLAEVYQGGQTYDFLYGDNGLLTWRVNSWRNLSVDQRDGQGRALQQTTTVGSSSALVENTTWRADSTLNSYAATRSGTGAWNDSRTYQYNSRNQLTAEPVGITTGSTATYAYGFDANKIGVMTSALLSGALTNSWGATASNSLAQITSESWGQSGLTLRASGSAGSATSLGVTLDGSSVGNLVFSGGRWYSDLNVAAGSHTLVASGSYATPPTSSATTNAFTVVGNNSVTDSYDGAGNVTNRVFGNGKTQALTWDGLGRLVGVTQRDSSNNGFNWTAVYDGLGRRLRTIQTPVATNVVYSLQTLAIDSFFDPQVEFQEVAVAVDGMRTWNVLGPDTIGRFGGMQGVGGLEATIREADGLTTPVLNDYFGNVLATVSGTNVNWSPIRVASYGPVLGYQAPLLNLSVPLAETDVWRSRRIDPSGFYWLGARYLDSLSGRFLSPDPLGHSASMDLYSAFQNDGINYFDSDGRVGKATGRFVGDTLNGLGRLLSDAYYSVGYAAVYPFSPETADAWYGNPARHLANTVTGTGQAVYDVAAMATYAAVSEVDNDAAYRWYGASMNRLAQLAPSLYGGEDNSTTYKLTYGTLNAATFFLGGESGQLGRFSRLEGVGDAASAAERLAAEESAFDSTLNKVKTLDFSTPPSGAVFYSGPGQGARAAAFAERTGGMTIEMTQGGRQLMADPVFQSLSPSQQYQVWQAASTPFAQGASGGVNAFINGARATGTFRTIEEPIFTANPNVFKYTYHY